MLAHRAFLSRPTTFTQDVYMQRPRHVLVLGGGVAGLSAAQSLAEGGETVTLVEREARIGGRAATVCCKAVNGACQQCGACLASDLVRGAPEQAGLAILTSTTLRALSRTPSGYLATLQSPQGERSLACDALIVATGFDHVDARGKGPYGYGVVPAVVTGEEMERRLQAEGHTAYDQPAPQRIAFIQCVGSRDEHAGRGYCSQVCCRYALRLARVLHARHPQAEITMFKMDVQHTGRDVAATWQAARDEGVRLVAGLPAVIRRSAADGARACFQYDDILAGEVARGDFDLVVLATGIQPRADAAEVAETLGINRDRYGFYATAPDGASTLSEGVFVAGSCGAPRSIAESIAHARAAAEACRRYLQDKSA